MMRPLLFIVGYHILSVPADRSADFVNMCSAAQIVYHSAGAGRRETEDGQEERRYFRLRPSAARRAERICKRYGIDVRTESRHGLPELAHAVCRRPGILLGMAFFAVTVFLSGNVIWDVRVEGNTHVSEETVERLLAESGISVGSVKSRLDIDSIENHVLILTDEISWISVNITGTVADVEIREAVAPPSEQDYIASNLVAARNGTVVRFEEVRGNISVELGEAVSEGQLLVGGVYGSDTEGTRFVRSSGQVIALCEREYRIEIPLKYEKKVYTGERKIKKSLIFFEKEVKFFGNSGNSYASCDTIDTVEYFDPFGLGKLPFGVRTLRSSEYFTEEATLTEAQAREQAYFILWQTFAEDAPDAVVASKRLTGRIEGDVYILEGTVESLENIAVEREIEVRIQ